MKRTFLFLLLALLAWEVRADYTPFVVEGKTWVIEFDYDWEMNTKVTSHTMVLSGDTLIGNHLYKKLMVHGSDGYNGYNGAYREEGGKVYVVLSGYATEKLQYDFNLQAGDKYTVYNFYGNPQVYEVYLSDYLYSQGHVLHRIGMGSSGWEMYDLLSLNIWIEGIGTPWGPNVSIYYNMTGGGGIKTRYCQVAGDYLYKDSLQEFVSPDLAWLDGYQQDGTVYLNRHDATGTRNVDGMTYTTMLARQYVSSPQGEVSEGQPVEYLLREDADGEAWLRMENPQQMAMLYGINWDAETANSLANRDLYLFNTRAKSLVYMTYGHLVSPEGLQKSWQVEKAEVGQKSFIALENSNYTWQRSLTEEGVPQFMMSIGWQGYGPFYGLGEPSGIGERLFPILYEGENVVYQDEACMEFLRTNAPSLIERISNAAKEPIEINETTFPDENFRNWVLSQSYGQDGILTDEEIAGIKKIIVSKNGIHSLKGIEYFTELTHLFCAAIQLEELDVSNFPKLESLDCQASLLTSLDVSKNTMLNELNCSENQLTSLDVSKNTALTRLHCDRNPLASLDVSKNTALEFLTCKDIQLTELDVSKNVGLKCLVCNNNQLTKLDVTNLTHLDKIACIQNRLERIIVSGCDNLSTIFCYNNQIKGEAIDELIEDLPSRPGERELLGIVDTENEQNVMTKAQVAAARAKGWIPCYKYGTFGYYGYPDYEGIDDPAESVTFTKDQMATIILPTAPDASKGKYYKLDRREDGQIIFIQETQPQARTPYIIVPNEDFSIDMSTLDVAGLSPDTVTVGGISFIGSYVRTELPALTGGDGGGSSSSYYDIIDQTPDCLIAQISTEMSVVGALRAYLVVTWDDPIHQGPTKGEPDKLEIVLHDDGSYIRAIDNGKWIMDNSVYNLSGQRVANGQLKPGLYIVGKKKRLVK